MHGTQKIGSFWTHIPGYEERQICQTCGTPESMEHILTSCNESVVRIIWNMAKDLWPHTAHPWPEISLGMILGCGSTSIPPARNSDTRHQRNSPRTIARLMRIIITESAHLIWSIRCERVIQERQHTEQEIKAKWLRAINKRLTEDKIIATRIKRDTHTKHLVRLTWEDVLRKQGDLPHRWLNNGEFLVGRRVSVLNRTGP